MSEPENRQHAIDAEAAEWVVRLNDGPLGAEESRSFEAWLGRGAAHGAAFDDALRTWDELGRLRHADPVASADADSRASGLRADPGAFAWQPRVSRRWPWRGVAASLLLAAGLSALHIGNPFTALRADHRTGLGEIRAVTLPDGSIAELNTRTAITVDFESGRREVVLIEGEAAFTAAAAADTGGWPFVVVAAGGEATALGTRFLVREQDGTADVTVLQHRVAVTPPTQAEGADALVLEAGQAVGYSRAAGLGPVRTIDAAGAAAWLRGKLVFDRVPLSQAVSELNRYRRELIVVLDSALAARRVSGVFRLDDLDAAIEVIAAELGARTASLPSFVTALY